MRFVWVVLILMAVIFVRFITLDPPIRDSHIDEHIEEKVEIKGLIVREPSHKENNQRLLVEVSSGARISVIAERFPRLRYGDVIRLKGKIREPEAFETETGRIFNYDSYLAKDGIAYQMLYPEVELISSGGGSVVFRALFAIRRSFLESISRGIREPNAALVSGITIGAEDGLGEKWEEIFRRVGLVHIIVLSGYNITIVADMLIRAFSFLPRIVALSSGAVGIIAFVLMAGASAATVRAGIMALLVIIAQTIGRRYDASRALCIAGGLMVLHNPHILLHDPSFQLSFLATLGLIYGTPLVSKWFVWIPEKAGFRESAVSTTATQLFVLPLLLYQTGNLSLISLPANISVLWTMSFVMLSTFCAGVVGIFSYWLAFPFALFAYLVSGYVLFIADVFSRIPFASLVVPPMHWGLLVLAYTALGFWIYMKKRGGHM